MPEKDTLIADILELELEMFLSVPTDRPYSCQQDPEGFRLHRGVQFSIWAEDTLESYLEDLQRAKKEESNLMTIKYARMEDLISRKNFNPLIESILDIYMSWQKEMIEDFPNIMAGGRRLSSTDDSIIETSFETYLKGELETYSDNTLSLFHRDLITLTEKGMNGSRMVYELLFKKMGFRSIEDAERMKKDNH